MDLFNRLRKMKLILIDDDEWIRDSMRLFFENEGCSLAVFDTAEEGIESTRKGSYDIFIVDYRLPNMDGLEFFRRIKQSHPDAVKILITAYGSEDVFSKGEGLGIQDFIQKPFTSKDIEESLSRCLENFER
jgi:DNA-binding NtrC family response regulator